MNMVKAFWFYFIFSLYMNIDLYMYDIIQHYRLYIYNGSWKVHNQKHLYRKVQNVTPWIFYIDGFILDIFIPLP